MLELALSVPLSVRGPEAHAATLGRAVAAEAEGFEAVWLLDAGDGAGVHLAAAWVAARTERIPIGLYLTLAATLHPVRLAEELATLDLMSDGRLAWCAAPPPGDARALTEQVDVARTAWSGERFAHAGAVFRVPELQCLPRPEQDEGPPVWIATGGAGSALPTWAAERGHPIWLDAALPEDELRALLAADAEARSAAGRERFAPRVLRRVGPSDGAPEACCDALRALAERLAPARLVVWLDGDAGFQRRIAALLQR